MFEILESDTHALKLLKEDHRQVEELFKQYESQKEQGAGNEKTRTAQLICVALTIHAAIEEELLYPAARKALAKEGKDLVDEAAVEHQSLKDIIGRLEVAPAKDPLYDAAVKVLEEYVKHHVKEEENELFPKLSSSDLDLDELGKQMFVRKAQLIRPARKTSGTADRARAGGSRAHDSRRTSGRGSRRLSGRESRS